MKKALSFALMVCALVAGAKSFASGVTYEDLPLSYIPVGSAIVFQKDIALLPTEIKYCGTFCDGYISIGDYKEEGRCQLYYPMNETGRTLPAGTALTFTSLEGSWLGFDTPGFALLCSEVEYYEEPGFFEKRGHYVKSRIDNIAKLRAALRRSGMDLKMPCTWGASPSPVEEICN